MIVAVVVLAAIAWATLTPNPETGAWPLISCMLCGPRGLADALLNVVLFVPLGMVAAMGGAGVAVAAGGLLSMAVEAAQSLIPGRHPSPGDILFNTLGAAVGFGLLAARRWWLTPGRRGGNRLALLWALAVGGGVFLTGWLLAPVAPEPPYSVSWRPSLREMPVYPGRVLSAWLGPESLGPWTHPGTPQLRDFLGSSGPVRAWVILGDPPDRLSPLVTIHDPQGDEILLLGIDGEDLVVRRQVRANRWRMDVPELRARDALAGRAVGDTVFLSAVQALSGQCFGVDQDNFCGIGATAADGWRLLYLGAARGRVAIEVLGWLWLAGLVLPIGFWARGWLSPALLIALAWYAGIRAPADTVLVWPGWLEVMAMVLGWGAGVVLGRWVRPSAPTTSQSDAPAEAAR
jgi:hypothetical protein